MIFFHQNVLTDIASYMHEIVVYAGLSDTGDAQYTSEKPFFIDCIKKFLAFISSLPQENHNNKKAWNGEGGKQTKIVFHLQSCLEDGKGVFCLLGFSSVIKPSKCLAPPHLEPPTARPHCYGAIWVGHWKPVVFAGTPLRLGLVHHLQRHHTIYNSKSETVDSIGP